MILVGNRRGSASELAAHLLNVKDNEHVELHEVRGFISDDLECALHEAYGISRGTRCKKFLYSLSLSPPQTESVPVEVFEAAIDRIEQRLGFNRQPRTIVFHEKKGRRHAHVVWSRINADTMTAIDPYQDKLTLEKIARELFYEHQWDIPAGLKRKEDADPLNYSHAEHQQAKRAKRDVRQLKRIFRECWERTDNRATFAHALKEYGFILAKGDRRGFVAVDHQGEVYSVARYAGVKAKDLRSRFGRFDDLPTVAIAFAMFDAGAIPKTKESAPEKQLKSKLEALDAKCAAMVDRHRNVRAMLQQTQQTRRIAEVKLRNAKLPRGLKVAWLKLSGKYNSIAEANRQETVRCEVRDRAERQNLIEAQLTERRSLQQKIKHLESQLCTAEPRFLSIDPEHALVIPHDEQVFTIKEKVNQNPEYILEVMTDTEESFTRNGIQRSLAKYIEDPLKLGPAIEQVMRSSELVMLGDQDCSKFSKMKNQRYSTRSFQKLKHELQDAVQTLSSNVSTFVSNRNINAAINQQNKVLKEQIGVTLSEQQEQAIRHSLNDKQLSAIIGLAGTGKSTILSVVKIALEKQGYHVHGAALSGKAADGLEQASHIKSRTLASWSRSWDQGNGLLTTNDVLVVDEAGMIGTKQLLRFAKEAKRSGAKLLLVGDPEQLQPINAGTPFHDICNTTNPAKLTEIYRQKEDWQKQASLDLAGQRTEEALKAYEANGNIIRTKDTSEAILRLVEDYMVDWELNCNTSSRLALAHLRKDVHAINQAIRQIRKSAGDLAQETLIQTDHGKRAFAEGDRIVFTQNDRTLRVRNGMLGTVKAIRDVNGKTEFIICIDGEPSRTININLSHYIAIDHGYATTIHKSQGVTVDRTFILSSPTMDRHLTYVAMTRHREDLRFYSSTNTRRRMLQTKRKEHHQVTANWIS